jgi:hypothetical protein
MRIFEDRTAAILSPTLHQKIVLAKIHVSANPEVAGRAISADGKLVAARDILARLGMIEYSDKGARLTAQGEELMANVSPPLIDETGSLTPEGEKLAKDGTQQTESIFRSIARQLRS